jgi:hypothetical protein
MDIPASVVPKASAWQARIIEQQDGACVVFLVWFCPKWEKLFNHKSPRALLKS